MSAPRQGKPLPLPALRRSRPTREPWQRPYFRARHIIAAPKPFVSSGPVRIITAADGGPVRHIFNYRSHCSTFATFSGKAARQQYCESATEMAAAQDAEMKTEYVDLQFQPARLEWLQPNGKWRSYTFDAAFELQNGTLVFDEYKATARQFSKPDVKAKMKAAIKVMGDYGIKVRLRNASHLQNRPEHAAVTALWAIRRTTVADVDVDKARQIIEAAGGAAQLGQLLEKLHSDRHMALGIGAALMMRRTIRIDLSGGLTPNAIVTIPPEVTRGRLRRFLAQFAEVL